MANHGFVTTHRNLTVAGIDNDIRSIVKRRFKDLVEVKLLKNWSDGEHWALWNLSVPCTGYKRKKRLPWGFEIWLTTPHKLEFRHSFIGNNDWNHWAQCCVMEEELAKLHNGWVSDEGVAEGWRGNPDKYPTFRSWLDVRYGPRSKSIEHGIAVALMKQMAWAELPEPLRELG